MHLLKTRSGKSEEREREIMKNSSERNFGVNMFSLLVVNILHVVNVGSYDESDEFDDLEVKSQI